MQLTIDAQSIDWTRVFLVSVIFIVINAVMVFLAVYTAVRLAQKPIRECVEDIYAIVAFDFFRRDIKARIKATRGAMLLSVMPFGGMPPTVNSPSGWHLFKGPERFGARTEQKLPVDDTETVDVTRPEPEGFPTGPWMDPSN
jgi:hypothetical protein